MKVLLRLSISMLFLVVIILLTLNLNNAQERAQDGWGIVSDKNGRRINNLEVRFYRYSGSCNSERELALVTFTWSHKDKGDGYYSWDLPTGLYDILVYEGTTNESGWECTYLPAGQWPNVVRNIIVGQLYSEKD